MVGMLMLLVHAVEIVIKVHKVLGSRLQILSSGFEGKSTSDRDYNFFFSSPKSSSSSLNIADV